MAADLLWVVPLYVLLALVFTFPLVLDFTGSVLGDLESDVWKHLWGMWWVKACLLEANVLPLHTHLLNAPYGGALFFIDPLNGLISTPLQLVWDPATVYNLMVLFNIVLAAVGGWCLARELSGNRYAAFFGGAVYGFSAYMMAYVTSGVTEAINLGWIPLFCLFFIRMLRNSSVADAVRSGVFFALATIGCWYYGTFCVLFATFYYLAVQSRRFRKPLGFLVGSVLSALRPPWSRNFQVGVLGLALALFALGRLPRLLDPFQGGALDFLMVAGALGFSVWLLMRLRGRATAGAAWSAFGALLPAGVILLLEAALGLWILGTLSTWPPLLLGLAGLQAVFVVPRAWRAWRVRWSETQACRGIVAPHVPFLVSLSLLLPCAAAILVAMPFLGQAGAEWIVGTVLLTVTMVVCLLLRYARPPRSREEGDLLADYRVFFSAHARTLLLLALVSVPALRMAWPDVPILPFLATWAALGVALQLGLAVLLALGRRADRLLTSRQGDGLGALADRFWRHALRAPLMMVLVAAVLVAGPAYEFRRTINSEESLVYRKRHSGNVDVHLSMRFLNVVRLVDYVRPGKAHVTRSYTVDKLTRVSYAGWITLVVVGLGLVLGPRRRRPRFWLFLALVFAMFSLGPFMYVSDEIYTEIRSPVYMLFFNYFPFFSQVSIPYRFTAMVMLSLGVLSSLALAGLLRRWAARDQALLVGSLVLGLLFDVTMFSPAPFPIPQSSARVPEYCRSLAEDPQEAGLIDYPIQRYRGELLPGEYFYYQVFHRKAMPNRVEGTVPFFVYQNAFANYLFMMEHARQDLPFRSQAQLQQGLEDLSRFQFRYLVIHDKLLRQAARERMHVLLGHFLGKPEEWPDRVRVYRIPAGLRFVDGKRVRLEEEPTASQRKEGPHHE